MRWRSPDPTPTVAKTQWAWAYRHTCSDARRLLQSVEDKEKPFQPSKRLVVEAALGRARSAMDEIDAQLRDTEQQRNERQKVVNELRELADHLPKDDEAEDRERPAVRRR